MLYRTWAILAFNATLWVPQIIHTYIKRGRKGPDVQFTVALCAMQAFMPLYLKMDPSNFLDQETDIRAGLCILFVMVL